ncbi:MAG: GatB/YqeY domain-containing protein [Candidatus Kapabacteria bacterium]|nr:GatB/YqeY domain-containing protein [Ignavibacteriota bacterium]MCW5885545.1 GatB/YqeY domain-containing protein [Candidatus Kapabacteria bacterium]
MSLEIKINEELKAAMKNGDKLRLDTLRSVRASIIEFAKSGAGREMTSDDEIKILNSLAKKRKDAIDMYSQAGRDDAAAQETAELAIIQEFLPKQLTDEEIQEIVKGIIEKVGATSEKDFGKVMGPAMKALSGQADGNKVQSIVKSILGATN